MRNAKLLWCLIAVVLTLAATTAGLTSASAAGPVRAHALTHTTRIVARPVTMAGRVAPGYTVSSEANSIDCRGASASPAAVDRDILFCSPDFEGAIACYLWRAHQRFALCLRDARTHTLASIRHTGVMPQALPPAHPTPLDLRLADGTSCSLRVGGTSAILQQHPSWQLYYYCQHNQALWGPSPYGVNTSAAVWTVQAARSDGTQHVTTRRVATAWFVGLHA